MTTKVALITGAAKRIGAIIAETLHQHGINVIIHYRHSKTAAEHLCVKLNESRSDSAITLCADLNDTAMLFRLIERAFDKWKRLDILINNASSFYPTPFETVDEKQWLDLMASNLTAPFFLSQAAAPMLKEHKGCIVNITDINGIRPLKNYSVYSIAKAGLIMLTKSLAKELGPDIRVNAIAPGSIIWPEDDQNELSEQAQQKIIAKTCLKRQGTPEEIANTVLFLIQNATYITGEIIKVDGGRLLK